jgi:hypothetical protein
VALVLLLQSKKKRRLLSSQKQHNLPLLLRILMKLSKKPVS